MGNLRLTIGKGVVFYNSFLSCRLENCLLDPYTFQSTVFGEILCNICYWRPQQKGNFPQGIEKGEKQYAVILIILPERTL